MQTTYLVIKKCKSVQKYQKNADCKHQQRQQQIRKQLCDLNRLTTSKVYLPSLFN